MINKIVFTAFPIPGLHVCQANQVETIVMAHRYLYHLAGLPVLSDRDYDAIASYAREKLPTSNRVHCPGGLFVDPEDYTEQERGFAHRLIV